MRVSTLAIFIPTVQEVCLSPVDQRAAWEAFVHSQRVLDGVPRNIVTSWQRSRLRLEPFQHVRLQQLSAYHLLSTQLANFNLISLARPVMEEIFQFLEHTQSAIFLTNNAGYVLEVVGHSDVIRELAALGMTPGGQFSEETIGTNSVSMAILERFPSAVRGYEHFLKQFHTLDEYAAPIFDLGGMPLGTICLMHYHHIPNLNGLALVNMGAKVIESQRQSDLLLAEQKGQLAQLNKILSAISESILVWNDEGTLIHINDAAQELIHISAQHALGRSYTDFINFPSFIQEAIAQRQPVTDVEAAFSVENQQIDSVLSLRFIIHNDQVQFVILILRAEKAVRKLVISQYGAYSSATLDSFIGESPRMQEIRRQVRICADADGAVLVRGEGGTGKTILAGAIHNEGRRKDNPFVTFPCSAYSNEMLALELFGYEEEGERSFQRVGQPSKFELARGGTLFIQDLDLLPLEAQAALLNVLELNIVQRLGSARPLPVDTRIIASTSANMEKLVARGIFRSDLYYRISVFEIKLPPLREQPEDIPLLVERILTRLEKQLGHSLQLAPGMMDVLQRYNWPGNIQELEIVLERAAAFAGEGGYIGPMHLPEFMFYPSEELVGAPVAESQVQPLDEMELELILRTARMCRGNQSHMAQILGISRTTLWRKLKVFQLSPRDLRRA